jgi:hypothetical protein
MAGTTFKEIVPDAFRSNEFSRIMRNGLRRVGYGMTKDFERTTATWEHKPDFKTHTHAGVGTQPYSVEVETDDPIWAMLEQGTAPHEIWAGWYTGKSDKRSLAFPSMFSPKTTPGELDSHEGSSGGETVFRAMVHHPGTEARRWIEEIRKIWIPKFRAEMDKSLSQFAKSCGQSMS